MGATYVFPAENDASYYDIPMWTSFYSANYSTWASKRTPQAVSTNWNTRIILPYPSNFNTLNNILYSNAPSIQQRGIEYALRNRGKQNPVGKEGFGGQQNVLSKEQQTLTGGFASQGLIAAGEMFESFINGGNVFRMDHMETVLKPGARRTHVFEFNLIAKTYESARNATQIALAFQANAHPGSFTRSIYTMTHPDIWVFGVSKRAGNSDSWLDGQGLTSVLTRVDINRSPIQNIPYTLSNGTYLAPLAINIKLAFTELEPALNWNGQWLITRSQKDI